MSEAKCISRLRCDLESPPKKLFFSLVDYYNNLFTSNDPKKIMEFYDSFKDRYQLIQWMKERPKGATYIHEVEGDKDIIVVIPTADFNGKYARECRENIFKGLFQIFVESGERGDFYFNYAHNCNVGIEKAMEYNPNWVVISNDDVYKIDPIKSLQGLLRGLENSKADVILTKPSEYHSLYAYIGKYTFFYKMFGRLAIREREFYKIQRKFNLRYSIIIDAPASQFSKKSKLKHLIFKTFLNVRITRSVPLNASFGIFSNRLLRELKEKGDLPCVFDEIFINAHEDFDLFLKLSSSKNISVIDFRIGDMIGKSLGNNYQRKLRTIAGDCYLFDKIKGILGESL
ncbi:MAG: hypothetical protein ACYCSO_06925 [Cuniculiplasma sp.]